MTNQEVKFLLQKQMFGAEAADDLCLMMFFWVNINYYFVNFFLLIEI